jgi:hypothetical protein
MGILRRIGQRVGSVLRLGGRFASSVGRIGSHMTDTVTAGVNTVASIPLIGGAIVGSPPFQALRGITSGAGQIAGTFSNMGSIMEKVGNKLPS